MGDGGGGEEEQRCKDHPVRDVIVRIAMPESNGGVLEKTNDECERDDEE